MTTTEVLGLNKPETGDTASIWTTALNANSDKLDNLFNCFVTTKGAVVVNNGFVVYSIK